MSEEAPKSFDPKLVEEKWLQFWENQKLFVADPHSKKESYCIVMPPPNVTGVLHMGHALVSTLQDVLIRYKRMCGYEALWVPGTDHAGIATQAVVERHLKAKEGKSRRDYSREEFVKHIWAWKETSEKEILNQLKKLGSSCDWSRLAFTMDDKRSRAVLSCFKQMFEDGLIYRGDYLVNWDPATQTALADDEVEYEERASSLWYIKYPLEDKSGHVVIATTRPETMLGDTAVAVSIQDERYNRLIGKQVVLPFTGRKIPIIADVHVDTSFGTGAVKVTPAHDPNDYEIAQRHNLPLINIMTEDGRIKEGEFAGLLMEEARAKIVEALKKLDLIDKIEPHTHRVGLSYRSKAVIEPFLSKQWFVKLSHFKETLINTVRSKQVSLIPDNFESTYFHWIHNLRDWCISRQLWWGHRIPIYYRGSDVVCSIDGPPPGEGWTQDSDVLDTWFSSALWPMSVLGWPDKTPDLEKFYPTQVLVTGHDILFFWVARMMVMGTYFMKEPPFAEVFLHGLIYGKSYWRFGKDGALAYLSAAERKPYDLGAPIPPEIQSKWEKMSKSKGNILDPLDIMNTYGTDAMRMALCFSATGARQIDLDLRRFEEFKNFANKIWNGARFVLMNLSPVSGNLDNLALEDKWILSLLNRTIQTVTMHLDNYAFDKAAATSYDFFWKEFCAYYLELAKPVLFGKTGTPDDKLNKQRILTIVLCNALRLLHPMAPFITEELFAKLKEAAGTSTSSDPYLSETLKALQSPACAVAPFPKVIRESDINPDIEDEFAFAESLLHTIRNIRAEMQIQPGVATDVVIVGPKSDLAKTEKCSAILKALTRITNLTLSEKIVDLAFASTLNAGDLSISIPLPPEMKEKEKARLLKLQEKLIQQQNGAKTQLSNPDFVAKAPAQLVDKLKLTLKQTDEELVELTRKLSKL